jgi:hypothetical protein
MASMNIPIAKLDTISPPTIQNPWETNKYSDQFRFNTTYLAALRLQLPVSNAVFLRNNFA